MLYNARTTVCKCYWAQITVKPSFLNTNITVYAGYRKTLSGRRIIGAHQFPNAITLEFAQIVHRYLSMSYPMHIPISLNFWTHIFIGFNFGIMDVYKRMSCKLSTDHQGPIIYKPDFNVHYKHDGNVIWIKIYRRPLLHQRFNTRIKTCEETQRRW